MAGEVMGLSWMWWQCVTASWTLCSLAHWQDMVEERVDHGHHLGHRERGTWMVEHGPKGVRSQVCDGITDGLVHHVGWHQFSLLFIFKAHLIAYIRVAVANQLFTWMK